jgi:hypothetical protein
VNQDMESPWLFLDVLDKWSDGILSREIDLKADCIRKMPGRRNCFRELVRVPRKGTYLNAFSRQRQRNRPTDPAARTRDNSHTSEQWTISIDSGTIQTDALVSGRSVGQNSSSHNNWPARIRLIGSI